MPLRLNRRSGCRRCLNTSRLVGGVGGKGCGGEEGGGGGGDCGGRATVVPAAAARGKRLVLVLPAEDLRGRQLRISTAELAGCCCARLPRCAPAQAPSRLSLRP